MSPRLTVLTVIALIALGAERAAPVDAQPPLGGTTSTVNAGPSDQIDPHVDCNLATFTDDTNGSQHVRFFNFATNVEAPVPTTGEAFLPDVSGTRIALTNVTPAGSNIVVFDTATRGSFTIPGGNERTNASIGGDLVAFEDRSFSTNLNASEIVVFNLATGVTTRLTNDTVPDTGPEVTPAGDAVVFTKCLAPGLGCDIYVARQTAPGVFVIAPLTGAAGEESNAATNGAVVVYASTRGGETDIYYQPITGGVETAIALPSVQRNPSVSGNLIAFESMTTDGNFDIFVRDISTGQLHRATQTPVDEVLSNISVCGGLARIVYSAPGSGGDFDVFAFTFQPPSSVVPFARLLAAVEIDRDPRANDDDIHLLGGFTLGAVSDGIDPPTEEVTLQVESYTATIPAGSFQRDRFGIYRFSGVVDGDLLHVVITPLGHGRFGVFAAAQRLDLPPTTNPVTVGLQIGNDGASVETTAFIH